MNDPGEVVIVCANWLALACLAVAYVTEKQAPWLFIAAGSLVVGMAVVIFCPEPKERAP